MEGWEGADANRTLNIDLGQNLSGGSSKRSYAHHTERLELDQVVVSDVLGGSVHRGTL